jgi:hypothetical protein
MTEFEFVDEELSITLLHQPIEPEVAQLLGTTVENHVIWPGPPSNPAPILPLRLGPIDLGNWRVVGLGTVMRRSTGLRYTVTLRRQSPFPEPGASAGCVAALDECGATTVIGGRTHTCHRQHILTPRPYHRCSCNQTWADDDLPAADHEAERNRQGPDWSP